MYANKCNFHLNNANTARKQMEEASVYHQRKYQQEMEKHKFLYSMCLENQRKIERQKRNAKN